MPPSGYSTAQSRFVGEMLRACAEALVAEAREHRVTLIAGLDSELVNIDRYLTNTSTTVGQTAILRLTEAFYKKVRARAPANKADFWIAVDAASNELESEMLAIKVPTVA